MRKYVIHGGKPLNGKVRISGAKNAAVAIIPAAILCDEVCLIENVPDISDVRELIGILGELGAMIKAIDKNTYQIDCRGIKTHIVPLELTRKLRASSYFLGAMLGRFKKAKVAPPGGCDFGVRPIDLHIKGFEALGATVKSTESLVDCEADRLIGNQIYLDQVSVGATVNIMLAAVKARGLTVIENAAREPHIVDLANFLNKMGANIRGAGTSEIKINGVEYLHSAEYCVIPDQIEAGTYMAAVTSTGGDVIIDNITPEHLDSITAKMRIMGAKIEEFDESIRIISSGVLTNCKINTEPHPGFPTDMQPQAVACLSTANGTSVVTESVWDNRFRYIDQLNLMGANISIQSKTAKIVGMPRLKGRPVMATDLRAGAALVIAALKAEGATEIYKVEYIERGYEDIVGKLSALGADIELISDQD